MYVVNASREALIALLPKNGIGAEIGVAEGEFSEHLLRTTQPSKLHLIDPWEHQKDENYQPDPNNVPQDEADRRFQAVRKKFAPEIERGQIEIHRQYSTEAASLFPDQYFDWIYLDAMHTYEACASDLRLFAGKVKKDGFILGHDYANNPRAREMGFGVIEAVNEFVKAEKYTFLALTFEVFPTYILAAPGHHPTHRQFVIDAIYNFDVKSEIKNAHLKNFQQTILHFADNTGKLVYSFA